jgi:hypothetical protein
MSWETNFLQICNDNSFDSLLQGKEIILVVPKMPEESLQAKLKALIPEGFSVEFKEGPRIITTESLRIIIQQAGAKEAHLEITGHKVVVTVESNSPALTEQESTVWPMISNLLKADQFITAWKILVNDTVMSEYDCNIAKALAAQTRPERNCCPTNDDILNLKISLENSQDVNDFINSL